VQKKLLKDFHKIWWKGDTSATEETIRFGSNPNLAPDPKIFKQNFYQFGSLQYS